MFTRLIFDNEMQRFLLATHQHSKMVQVLLHSHIENFLSDEGNFIKKESDSVVSYLPKSKYPKMEEEKKDIEKSKSDVDKPKVRRFSDSTNPFKPKIRYPKFEIDPYSDGIGRVKIKIGRFLKKFLLERSMKEYGLCMKDIEGFVNLFKSYFNTDPKALKIIQGDDILKYYLQENYHSPDGNRYGTIWSSCMRHKERNRYMELYTKNSFIKMLVLFDENNKVRARALLWDKLKDSNEKEYKIMDRIYTVYDHDVNLFKNWANENGYIPKFEQSCKTESLFDVNGEPRHIELRAELENSKFDYYPYLDSFKFFNSVKGQLFNSPKFEHSYVLTQLNGGLEPEVREQPTRNLWGTAFTTEPFWNITAGTTTVTVTNTINEQINTGTINNSYFTIDMSDQTQATNVNETLNPNIEAI